MKTIYTEMIISQSPTSESGAGTVFDEDCIIVRVDDDAAGPYLVIHGRTSTRQDGSPVGTFCLDETEIDGFAAACKALLAQAQ